MIEVGLIGFGLAGRAFHAPVISAVPGLHLAAILQRSGSEAAHIQRSKRTNPNKMVLSVKSPQVREDTVTRA